MEVLSSASGPSRTDRTMSNSSSCSMDSTTKKTSMAKISKAASASASAASANTSRWCSKTTLTTNMYLSLFKPPSTYRKVASSNTSRLEAHAGFFQIAYEGDF